MVLWNTPVSIFSNPSLRVTFDKLEQFSNADLQISLIELGITIDFILVPANASSPIFSIPWGIFVFLQPEIKVLVFVSIIALQLLWESYVLLLELTFISFNLEQFKKELESISLTELGMIIDVILVPLNAKKPICSKPSLRVTFDKLEQS